LAGPSTSWWIRKAPPLSPAWECRRRFKFA
jgi:hypothetical protein